MQPEKTLPVILDSISQIFVGSPAMKSSTRKHSCLYVSLTFIGYVPSHFVLLAQRTQLFALTEKRHLSSTTQYEQGIHKYMLA